MEEHYKNLAKPYHKVDREYSQVEKLSDLNPQELYKILVLRAEMHFREEGLRETTKENLRRLAYGNFDMPQKRNTGKTTARDIFYLVTGIYPITPDVDSEEYRSDLGQGIELPLCTQNARHYVEKELRNRRKVFKEALLDCI